MQGPYHVGSEVRKLLLAKSWRECSLNNRVEHMLPF